MPHAIDLTLLHGRWLHAREEDEGANQVYRPIDFAFPPSRGRSGLRFDADGSFRRIGLGRTDLSHVLQGAWQADTTNNDVIHTEIDGEHQTFAVQSLEKDRLVIRR